MILADLEHAAAQAPQNPALAAAFAYLRTLDAASLSEGRYPLDGEQVYAIVAFYETKVAGPEVNLECHRKYIDLQYVAAGQEMLAWIPAELVAERTPYDASTDSWQGMLPAERMTWIKCSAGQVVVFFPEDAHAPQFAAGKQSFVKKVVIKVAVP